MNTPYSTVRKEPEDTQAAETGPEAPAPRTGKSSSAFRTISEVATDLDVPQHVLRFWETKFSQVRPLKRGGGRRYYRPEDVELLKSIHKLLYTEGYTIKGVQKLLKEQGRARIVQNNKPAAAGQLSQQAASATAPSPQTGPGLSKKQRTALENVLGDLRALRRLV